VTLRTHAIVARAQRSNLPSRREHGFVIAAFEMPHTMDQNALLVARGDRRSGGPRAIEPQGPSAPTRRLLPPRGSSRGSANRRIPPNTAAANLPGGRVATLNRPRAKRSRRPLRRESLDGSAPPGGVYRLSPEDGSENLSTVPSITVPGTRCSCSVLRPVVETARYTSQRPLNVAFFRDSVAGAKKTHFPRPTV